MGVAVCTDTTNYLPRQLVRQNGIHEVSLYVNLEGNQQREADILEDTDRKPILTLDGEITPIERVRTAQRAVARMTEFVDELHADGRDGWVVQHIQAPDEAERLVEYGRGVFGTEPAFVSEVGPVIGAHVGPGLLGVGGVPAELLH